MSDGLKAGLKARSRGEGKANKDGHPPIHPTSAASRLGCFPCGFIVTGSILTEGSVIPLGGGKGRVRKVGVSSYVMLAMTL